MANKKLTGGRTGAGSTIGKSKPTGYRDVKVTEGINKLNQNARKYSSEGYKQYLRDDANARTAYNKKINAVDTDRRNLAASRKGSKTAKNTK